MIGVCFLGQTARYAVQTTDAEQPVIKAIGEQPFPKLTTPDELLSHVFPEELSRLFQSLRDEYDTEETDAAGIAIPAEWVHLYTLPIDPDLSPEDVREYAEWTFSQRFGEQTEKFQPRFYALNSNDGHETVLTVVFPAGLLETIRETAEAHGTVLRLVTIDVFAAWSTIPFSEQPEFLCKYSEDFVEISQSIEDEVVGIALYRRDASDALRFLRGTIRSEVADEWKEFLSSMSAGDASGDETVWVYGNAVPETVREQVDTTPNWRFVTPFSRLDPGFRADLISENQTECQYTEVGGLLRQMTRTTP